MRADRAMAPPRVMVWASALSLDAPVVALAWQELFASALGVAVGWPGRVVLGLAVWVVYAADRWLDGRRIPEGRAATPRHRFAVRFRWPIAIAMFVAASVGLAVALTCLEPALVRLGLGLGGGVAAYLALNQATPQGWGMRIPKELAAALIFAVGTLLLPLARAPLAGRWALATGGIYGALCLINLVAVAAWDREQDLAQGQASVVTQAPGVVGWLPAAAWVLSGVALCVGVATLWGGLGARAAAVPLCEAVSGAGLGLLLIERAPGSPELRGLVADVVLLTPLPVLGVRWLAGG